MTEHHDIQPLTGGRQLFNGTLPMVIPAGGAHVRQVEIRVPLLAGPPTINATIFATDSPGNAFAIWDIKVNALGAQTQIVISATNVQTGQPVPYQYWCSYMIVGTPV